MWDEDAGQPVTCPFCGQDDVCSHMLAVVDKSIVECRHGRFSNYFGKFLTLLEDAFAEAMEAGDPVDWGDELIREMWSDSVDDYDNDPNGIAINGFLAMRLLVSLFQESDGVEYSGNTYDGGGPGLSSALSVFYAEDPEAVCNQVMAALADRLHVEP